MLFIQALSAALTPLIAIIAAYVAYQQYRTNRDKLRLDLYDRRLKVFTASISFIHTVVAKSQPETQDLNALRANTEESSFLFGSEIRQFLSELLAQGTQLRAFQRIIAVGSSETVRKSAQVSEAEILDWFAGQLEVAERLFAPYLSFRWIRKGRTNRSTFLGGRGVKNPTISDILKGGGRT